MGFVVLEYIETGTLDERLAFRPLGERELSRIGGQLAARTTGGNAMTRWGFQCFPIANGRRGAPTLGCRAMRVRRFPRAVGSLPALVAFVRDFFADHGMDAEQAYNVDLVLEELFTNMVRHARGGTPEIEVGLVDDGALLTMRLRDEMTEPWDPSLLPEPDLTRPIQERRPGGLGIHFVRQVTRDLRFEHVDGANVVTAVVEVPR